jgi:hypothetical protein
MGGIEASGLNAKTAFVLVAFSTLSQHPLHSMWTARDNLLNEPWVWPVRFNSAVKLAGTSVSRCGPAD